jgi:hypothetical protein
MSNVEKYKLEIQLQKLILGCAQDEATKTKITKRIEKYEAIILAIT